MVAFGAALAGLSLMPLSPLLRDREGAAGDYIRDLGERARVRALCVTTGTGELAAKMDPALPRIYLDSPAADRGWAGANVSANVSIKVSIGGVSKRLPLSRTGETLPKTPPEAGSAAVIWPDGAENSHQELLSQAAGGQSMPRLFPRDRIISVSSLAEKGAFVLGVLAAALGGASLNLPAEFSRSRLPEPGETGEPPKAIELLRPSVLIGDAAFLENLYARKGAPIAEGPLSRNALTRPLAQYLGGRELIRALGGNVRFYGFVSGPDLGAETAKALSRVHLPRGKIASPEWEKPRSAESGTPPPMG
jgi:hypothetical protein